MGIQAGSKGSRTRKFSHRGQDRGTGIQEALVVHLLHGARLQVGMDHRRGPVREAGVGRATPRQGGHRWDGGDAMWGWQSLRQHSHLGAGDPPQPAGHSADDKALRARTAKVTGSSLPASFTARVPSSLQPLALE